MKSARKRTTSRARVETGEGGHVLGKVTTDFVQCVEVLYPPRLVLQVHKHDRACIAVVFAGGLDETLGDVRFHVEASSIYVRPAAAVHSNQFGEEHTRVLVIELTPEFLARYPIVSELVAHASLFQGASIVAVANSLSNEIRRTPGALREMAVDGLAVTLATLLMRKGSGVVAAPTIAWVNEVLEYLKEHFRERITVNEVASRFDLHPVHLGRTFKREMKVSVIEFVHKLRVEHAADALTTSSASISSISDDCGFSDQAHFTRIFKSIVGATPRSYRRMKRDGTNT